MGGNQRDYTPIGRLALRIRRGSLASRIRGGGWGWGVGALDYEPEHEGYFGEEGGLGEEKRVVLVLGEQFAGEAEEDVGDAVDG